MIGMIARTEKKCHNYSSFRVRFGTLLLLKSKISKPTLLP